MPSPTSISLGATVLASIGCISTVSTDAIAYRGAARVGGVHAGGIHTDSVYRGGAHCAGAYRGGAYGGAVVGRGIGVGAAAVGAAAGPSGHYPSSPLYAQDASVSNISQEYLDASIGRRLRVVIAALRLTSDQTKYWPPIEHAVRTAAQARFERVSAVLEAPSQNRDVDLRTNALVQRAAELKSIVDAWQPLYSTLTSEQRQRVHLLGRLNPNIGRLFLYTL